MTKTKCQPLCWDATDTPAELHGLLRTLAEEYSLYEGPRRGAIAVEFAAGAPAGTVEVTLAKGCARVVYDKPCHAARGVGALLAGLVKPGRTYREHLPFETFGIMLDCSRNAVMTIEHFQSWLRRLALLGYDMAMLYTEDTYELPEEPYFGYLRGRYSAEELRAIDDYAARLGIEMIGCIQALGHLEEMLKWPAYSKVRDTSSVLLADHDATYALIDKMLAHFAGCFRSRRIHVGMDETHDLGRGRFQDLFGHQRGYDIITRHLGRVLGLAQRHGLQPMIWSDMFFRMGNPNQGYYDPATRIPDDVKAAVPAGVQLVYWDYYHDNEAFYTDWIGRHREMNHEPIMASGVWTWHLLWYGRQTTEKNVTACLRACRATKLKEFFFTLWGDDGAFCEFDSALAGLAYGAELAYAALSPAGQLERRFAAVCGADYKAVTAASDLNEGLSSPAVLWDDPLLGIYWNDRRIADRGFWKKAETTYARVLARLGPHDRTTEPIDLAHAAAILRCLLAKIRIRAELVAAYAAKDRARLRRLAQRISKDMLPAVDGVLESFRRQWYRRNKPFGFETIQIRLGGLRQRYLELQQRLSEFASGKVVCIPELDEAPPVPPGIRSDWRTVAAAGIH